MYGIYTGMAFPTWRIYQVYPSEFIYQGYDRISKDIPCISTKYIHGISMDIHGILFDVYTLYILGYPWIFLAFWNLILRPAHAAGLIQCAHVCGLSRVFYCMCHPGSCARGNGDPQKALPDCRQPPPAVAGSGGDCGSGGVVAGIFPAFFPSLVVGNDLNLGERWGRRCLQGRWPMFQAAEMLACSKYREKIKLLFVKAVDHALVIDLKLEGWFEC